MKHPDLNCATDPSLAGRIGDCYLALCNSGNDTFNDYPAPPGTPEGCYLQLIIGGKPNKCGSCSGDEACALLDTTAVIALSAGKIFVCLLNLKELEQLPLLELYLVLLVS